MWYGGNKLAHDLSIKRVRMHFASIPDPSEIEDMSEIDPKVFLTTNKAYDEWSAASKHLPTVYKGSEFYEPSKEDIMRVTDNLQKFHLELKDLVESSSEPQNIARASRYISGAFHNMARRFERSTLTNISLINL